MKQLFTFFLLGWFVVTNIQAQTNTNFANATTVSSFPYTETNVSSMNGGSNIEMLGGCVPACCSTLVYKIILPVDGSLHVEMTNSIPLSSSILAYTPIIPNPMGNNDLTYFNTIGNFCGFRDTLLLGSGYNWTTNNWDNINNYVPAGTYYVYFFNHNNQTNNGSGNTDIIFQFVSACDNILPQPEIEVKGNGLLIANGDDTPSTNDNTDFGSLVINEPPISKTYTIENVSPNTLEVSDVIISGTNATDFTVTASSASMVNGNSSTTFTIECMPTTAGLNTATITIANSDCDKAAYTFDVQIRVLGTNPSNKRGQMFEFSGSSEYIKIDDVANPMDGVTQFTFEAWINADAAQSGNDRIISVNTAGGGNVILFYLDDGVLETYDGATDNYGSDNLKGTGWHHVAFTHDNSSHRVYLDGVLKGTKAGSVSTFSSTNLWSIGQEYDSGPSPGDYWKGKMDEVRIWKSVLTEQEIREKMHLTFSTDEILAMPDLVAYYQFDNDDAAGITGGVKDILGNSGTSVGGSYAASEIAVGAGVSATQTVTSNITYNFANTDLALQFSSGGGASIPNDDIVITKITAEAVKNGSTGEMTNTLDDYWIIKNYGTNTNLAVTVKFEFEDGFIDDNLTANHFVHKRGSNQYEAADWTDISPFAVNSTGGDNSISVAVTTFSQFYVSSSTSDFQSSVLPVELLDFDARKLSEKEVELYWTTAFEVNNYGFDIERSGDGKNWEKIGFVAGIGNSLELEYYRFKDMRPIEGINYYRLKQIDFDGQVETHKIVSISFRKEVRFSIFPNPAVDNVTLRLKESLEEEGQILIFDIMGRLITQQKISTDLTDIPLDISQLTQKGLYLIQFQNGQQVESIYFEKL